MRTIAVVNRKGGSGKTTTAVSVAAAFAERDLPVLLIDLDPQASATAWLGRSEDRGVLEAFTGSRDLASAAVNTRVRGLQLIPASSGLLNAERAMKGDLGAGIVRAFERLPDSWAVVIVDCPPSMSYVAVGALMAVREAIVPVEAHAMALPGVAAVVAEMRRLQSGLNPTLWDPLIVACRVNRTLHSRQVVAELDRRYGALLAHATIRESIRLAEAEAARLPITAYAPASGVCLDYRLLTDEVLEREPLRAVHRRRASGWRHMFDRIPGRQASTRPAG
ncbi:MAG: ParA family protein [Chloroflexota bacterium]